MPLNQQWKIYSENKYFYNFSPSSFHQHSEKKNQEYIVCDLNSTTPTSNTDLHSQDLVVSVLF